MTQGGDLDTVAALRADGPCEMERLVADTERTFAVVAETYKRNGSEFPRRRWIADRLFMTEAEVPDDLTKLTPAEMGMLRLLLKGLIVKLEEWEAKKLAECREQSSLHTRPSTPNGT